MYYVSLRLNMVFLNGYGLLLFPMKWIGSVLVKEKMVFLKWFTGFVDIVLMNQLFCTPLIRYSGAIALLCSRILTVLYFPISAMDNTGDTHVLFLL